MSKEPPNRPAVLFGVRRSAIVETLLYLGVALIIDYLFFGGNRFWNVAPHPFWPLVLLISAQYGTSEGLIAAFVATIALLAGKLPARNMSQDVYDYMFYVIRTPLMWFTASVIWGELRGRHSRETTSLREELETTKSQSAELSAAYKKMAEVKEKLEVHVAGQLKTSVRMYEAARGIDKLEPAEVVSGVLNFVRIVMNPEKFSLFLLTDGGLALNTEQGWKPEDKYSTNFNSNSVLFQEVIGRERFLCSVSRDEEPLLDDQGILAGPLVSSETGDVVGMLKIEKLGFLELNLSSLQTFKVLCEWIATAYANALRYKLACSDKVFDESTSLFSHGFFDRQTSFLSELGRRVGFDVSMVSLRLDNADELTSGQVDLIPALIGDVVKVCLRKTDMAFDYRQTGWKYSVVLPNTPLENAQIVADKLLKRIRETLPHEAERARFSANTQVIYRHEQVTAMKEDFTLRPANGLLPSSVFDWYTDYLIALATRIGFEISLVELRPDRAEHRQALHKAISEIAPATLRQADLMFASPDGDEELRIVLPGTNLESARVVTAVLIEKASQILKEDGRVLTVVSEVGLLHTQQTEEVVYG
jgi:GGDEF domain-containing protein